jgi:hypothetical protein
MTVARRLSGSASREFYQSFKQSFRQLAFIVGFVFVQVFDDVEKTSDDQLQLLTVSQRYLEVFHSAPRLNDQKPNPRLKQLAVQAPVG